MEEGASHDSRRFGWSDTWPARLGKSLLSSLLLPGDVYAGRVTPNDPDYYERAADLAGSISLSTLAGPRGVLGSGVARPPRTLPMDVEARMARARKLGFQTSKPYYHGTDQEFGAFDLTKAGKTTGTRLARQGIWTASDPDIAAEFARLAAIHSGGREQIYPLLQRSRRPARIELRGDEPVHAINHTLAEVWEQGHDSVLLRNAPAPNGRRGDFLVVRSPAQLRSPQAAFDPSRRKSRDLLAGIAGAGVVGSTLTNEGLDDE